MENKIKITEISIENNKIININYEILGEWKKYFNEKEKFFIQYDIDIQNVPNSVKVIPFLCNILPIAWISNAIIEIESIDSNFYECIENLKKAYKKMYPEIEMDCTINVKNIENISSNTEGKKAVLFSGGVDSFSTLIGHINEKPELITMCGADIKVDDYKGWQKVRQHTENIGKQYNLERNYIKSNLRTFIDTKKLDEVILESTRR